MIAGPWTHHGPLAAVGELPLGLGAHGQYASQWAAKHGAFFDRHTRAAESDLPVVQYYVIHDGWRTADDWPPLGATRLEWNLASDGHANTLCGDGILVARDGSFGSTDSDSFEYDPANPVRTIGGRMLANFGLVLAGPFDQTPNERRDDVLCYTSEPLKASCDLVGPMGVELYASSSAVDTDFVAHVCAVSPDGTSLQIGSGIMRARYRNGFDREVPLEPGRVERFSIHLGHIGWRLRPDDRLRVWITSSDFPRFDRNMNTGRRPGEDAAGVIAQQTVQHDRDSPSRLWVTVLPAAGDVHV
jgi:putative CocE/NonD family hydrolase